MDIRDKLLQTVDVNDPQFEVLLKNAIQTELTSLEEELRVKKALNERKRKELAGILERRKNLKKNIQEHSELLETMKRATFCLQDYSKDMMEKLETTKMMMDQDSLQKIKMIEETEKLRQKYEKKWREYQAEFEKAPLAKERKAAKEELLKIEIKLDSTRMNIKTMIRNNRDYNIIQKKIFQNDIIALAELWLNHRKNVNDLEALRREDAELKSKIAEQDKQIEAFLKEETDEEKQQKAMARFKMPPPVMDKKLVETIFPQSQLSQSTLESGKKHRSQHFSSVPVISLDDTDTDSISSSVFEEMCAISEKRNFVEVREAEQVENEPEVISLTSNLDYEYSEENCREKSYSSNQKERNEKSVSKKPEKIKRPSNSCRESPVNKKKNRDCHSSSDIHHKVNTDQQISTVDSNTIKKIKENVRKQGKTFDLPARNVQERTVIVEENNTMDTVILSTDHRAESVDSFPLNESNDIRKDSEIGLNSDLSIQTELDDQTQSITSSNDNLSLIRSEINSNGSNAVNPDPPVSAISGMFTSQNKGLNFGGIFFK